MEEFSIHVVCPNPALDRLQTVSTFVPFEVNRVTSVRSIPGGKGLIVARASRRMGATVTAHGFAGGRVGRVIRDGCVDLGVADHHVEIAGETRVTPVIIEQETGRSTVLNELGPEVSTTEQATLLAGLTAVVRPGDVVVSTGSLPPGCDVGLHARVARLAIAAGALAIIDAHGDALRAVISDLQADPVVGSMVVKPNVSELGEVLARDLSSLDASVAAVRALSDQTGATFVITRGSEGAVLAGDESLVVNSPQVETVNATGSGDSFLAGLAVALGGGATASEALALGAAMGAANASSLVPDIDAEQVDELRTQVTVASVVDGR